MKFKLSPEGMGTLMKRMSEIAQNQENPDVTGLLEAPITTAFVRQMTKVKDMEDVTARNDQLSKTYNGLLSLYGFDTMYDMYLYAKSNDVYPEELQKSEDVFDVIQVTRTITRNGEPLDIVLTERIEKSESKPAAKKKPAKKPAAKGSSAANKPGEEEEEDPVYLARELKGSVHGQEEPIDPKKVAKLKRSSGKMPRGNKPFNETSKYYFELHGPEGKPAGIAGFSEEKAHLKMDFFMSDGQTHGVATRAFFELCKLALKKEKGVKMDDHFEARPLFVNAGMERKGDQWHIKGKDLLDNFGMEPTKKS